MAHLPIGDLGVPTTLPSPAPGDDKAAELKTELDGAGVTLTNAGEHELRGGDLHQAPCRDPGVGAREQRRPLGGLSAMSRCPGTERRTRAPIPVDILIDTASGRLDSIVVRRCPTKRLAATSSVTVALSDYDEPVTVTAPPADQTTDEPLLAGAFGS